MKESHTSRLIALVGFLATVLLLYLGILFNAQILHHEEYLAQSLHSITKVEPIYASRGIITDRNGQVLVSNKFVYDLTFDTSLLKENQDPNAAIFRLLQLCKEQNLTWLDSLPISAQQPFTYTLDSVSDTQRRNFLTYLKSLKEVQTLLGTYLVAHPELAVPADSPAVAAQDDSAPTPPEVQGKQLLEKLPLSSFTAEFLNRAGLTPEKLLSIMAEAAEVPSTYSLTERRMILGIRYELALRRQNGYKDTILVENIDTEFISLITDGKYAGAKVTHSSVRQYETKCGAHILGTVSRIFKEDLEKLAGKGYDGNDWIGRSGVEAAFEEYLRGTDGRRIIATNSAGKVTGEYYEVEPQPGSTVELTIDLELQKVVEDTLAKTVTKMNRKDGQTSRGAGVVVEKVGTGEILALASYPTYDLSTYRQDISRLNTDPSSPLVNRATQSSYPPGSTFKMLTAVAALEEGVVSLKETIKDTGRWYYPETVPGTTPWGYKCWKGSGHGKVDLVEAITVSCNYFFYEMGYRLGIDRLSKWAADFGLGESTGLEIGDKAGILASREEREANGGTWYGGDTVMAAIGQSDNLFTPIQLSNYICTLVSGGERYETHLLKTVKAHDNSKVLALGETKPVKTLDIQDSTIAAVKKGMHNLTTKGSLHPYFKNCVVSAGAKTGTAQLGSKITNNGVFVCFAPYEDPEIAVSIVIEKGGTGAALASTAVEILNAYFSTEDVGMVVLPEDQLLP